MATVGELVVAHMACSTLAFASGRAAARRWAAHAGRAAVTAQMQANLTVACDRILGGNPSCSWLRRPSAPAFLKMSSCSEHCLCYTGWDGQGSREPLAAAAQAALGSAARRATGAGGAEGAEDVDAGEEPEDSRGVARDNETVPGTVQAVTGEASRDVVGGAGAGPRRAANDADAADGGLAVASPAPSGGDAGRRTRVSRESFVRAQPAAAAGAGSEGMGKQIK
jgi:hypothetical protein